MGGIHCSVNLFITPKDVSKNLFKLSWRTFLKESLLHMFPSRSIYTHKKNSVPVPSWYSNASLFYRKSELLLVLNYGNLNVSSKLFRFELRSILVVGIQQKMDYTLNYSVSLCKQLTKLLLTRTNYNTRFCNP